MTVPYYRTLVAIITLGVPGMRVTPVITVSGGFSEPEEWRFDWDRPYTCDEWLDQVPTMGGHPQLQPAKLAELLAGLGAEIDALGGGFTMNYATVAVTAARTP